MDLNQIGSFISTIGFPCAVAAWLLWRTDKKEEQTQAVLMEIKEVLARMVERMDRQ